MSLRQWFFAAAYACGSGRLPLDAERRRTAGAAHGDVLEIGPGNGANLRFYAAAVRLTVAEPNPHMVRRLLRNARRLGRDVRVETDVARGLPFPEASFDAVVSTLVLCSVPDVSATLREVTRVLRPPACPGRWPGPARAGRAGGGAFYFFEHVAAPAGTRLRRWQDRLNRPWWGWVGDGCNCNRETGAMIRAAGFESVSMEETSLPMGPALVRPAIIGWGYRAGLPG